MGDTELDHDGGRSTPRDGGAVLVRWGLLHRLRRLLVMQRRLQLWQGVLGPLLLKSPRLERQQLLNHKHKCITATSQLSIS